MLNSMTAYGKGESAYDNISIVVELKTVNNRYRDIVIKIPACYSSYESDIRKAVSSRISRGRVEVFFNIKLDSDKSEAVMSLNKPLVRAYLNLYKELSDEFGLTGSIDVNAVLKLKDVIITDDICHADCLADCLKDSFISALSAALDSLCLMKRSEGEAIADDFIWRLDKICKIIELISIRSKELPGYYQEKLRERVANILKGTVVVDESRLAQEVAVMADKSDITEEIVRLESHISQFSDSLRSDEAMGRRLDFLVQEMNREVNTIGSKAGDTEIAKHVLDLKCELEKIREQVQNIE